MKRYRNKNCKNCPQNKREDLVWMKGFEDGKEIVKLGLRKIIGKVYWKIY